MKQEPFVAVIGAVNMDICGRPRRKLIFRDSNPGTVRLTPGGVGRNIAHDLCLLGTPVRFVTVFGDDANGAALRQSCERLGMDLSCAQTLPGVHTSSYLYITDERGEMQLGLSDTDSSACITPQYLSAHLDALNSAAVVVAEGNLPAETLHWIGGHVTRPLFVDPVSVTKAERLRGMLGRIHTFKPNITEGSELTGETEPEAIVTALLRQGVHRVFLSMGSLGILAGEGELRAQLPCLPTQLVNTTGGGDAVMAALVWAHLHGRGLRESTLCALRAGKCAVEYDGTNNPALCAELLETT
ncbi:MAG: MarR family transcriptional regulator [Oscillospiraceae bacterium]|nr:MarR family transcriptional regulator [Oscillospiraceae bacterium]